MPQKTILILGGHALAISYAKKIKSSLKFLNSRIILAEDNPLSPAKNEFMNSDAISFWPVTPATAIMELVQSEKPSHFVVVPDHTAPHVMLRVVMNWLCSKNPQLVEILHQPATPFMKKMENNAINALSFATWLCPPDCDEPAICPHTTKNRDWQMEQTLNAFNEPETHKLFFKCYPLLQEISQITGIQISNAWRQCEKGIKAKNVLVATFSECHGIVGKINLSRSLT